MRSCGNDAQQSAMQLTAAEWAAVAPAAMAPQQQYAGTFRRRAAAKPRACKPCGRRAKGKAVGQVVSFIFCYISISNTKYRYCSTGGWCPWPTPRPIYFTALVPTPARDIDYYRNRIRNNSISYGSRSARTALLKIQRYSRRSPPAPLSGCSTEYFKSTNYSAVNE